MDEFGELALLVEGATHEAVRDLAVRIVPDSVIIADRPASTRTAEELMSMLRHLPTEVVELEIDHDRVRDSAGRWTEAQDFYTKYLFPRLFERTRLLMVAPAGLLDALLHAVDPAHVERSVVGSQRMLYGFDRRMNPRLR